MFEALWLREKAYFKSNRTLWQLGSPCGLGLSRDFKSGFRCAYRDIITGGMGIVPAVPPKKYWTACYRTPTGRLRAQDWLEGYRIGAEHARADGLDRYRDIATSIDSIAGYSPFDSSVFAEDMSSYAGPMPGGLGNDPGLSSGCNAGMPMSGATNETSRNAPIFPGNPVPGNSWSQPPMNGNPGGTQQGRTVY